MDVSIIIVSWNVRALLEKCLASLSKIGEDVSFEVIVVDNASRDGTVDEIYKVKDKNQKVQIIRNVKNLGFSAANNQGIRVAKGKYILLLNPDTEFTTSSLSGFIRFMETHPRCGILGPKLLNSDGTLQQSVRCFPDAWSPLLFSLRLEPKKYLAIDFDYTRESRVDQVMGACFLIRRECIEKIGLLDEKFFIWFEEVDYCKRAKNAGWEVWYTPDISVLHHGGQSFAQVLTARKQWMYSISLLYYFWKHHLYGAWIVNAVLVPFRLIISLFFSK